MHEKKSCKRLEASKKNYQKYRVDTSMRRHALILIYIDSYIQSKVLSQRASKENKLKTIVIVWFC
jgi:hypothetical protein